MDLLERASLLDELGGALAATAAGGRVVLVAGEAGIGKSALVRRFTGWHSADARFLLGSHRTSSGAAGPRGCPTTVRVA
jgi:ABC-type transport system involved in cytochrome c biogenesis ATPase subunit